MATTDWFIQTGDDLRTMAEVAGRIAQQVNDMVRRLATAIEGRSAAEMSDPRARLLVETLAASRITDAELNRLNQILQRVARGLSAQLTPLPAPSLPQPSPSSFERERAELNTSILDLREERNELETLYGIGRTLNSTLELDKVLQLVMDQVIDFVKAERGFLMLVNPATGEPEFAIARDRKMGVISESAFAQAQISRNAVMNVIKTRQPLLTDDAQTDNALKAHKSVIAYRIRSVMCAPLVVRDNCIGAVYVDSRFDVRLFRPKHLELLLAFCNQAAIAIDNARLFADLNKAIQQVREDKQYMDNIFESIANGVITTDSAGVVTTFNSAAYLILRVKPQQIIGKHYTEAFNALPEVQLVDLLRSAYLQHEHGTVVNQAIDAAIPGRDGEINLNCYVSSLRDIAGSHIGMALVIDDRTELKRSEARAKEVRRIFERYVHPNVVEQLIQNPLALNLGGETKEISIVFADIRGYTSLSETMPPAEVMNLVNRYLNIMCEAIWEEEGTVTAFLGDAVMAIFNAPLQQKNHAIRAVRAAWKMRQAVQNYQARLPQDTHIAYGIGVNTGFATVGNVGAQERLQNYTAIGDVVNVASRLQNSATENNILLNESTYIQVYRFVQVGQAFPLSVKNKSTPLNVRYLMGLL